MPKGQYDRSTVERAEDYEIESLEETACRLELIVRQIYYLGKDGETTGYTDYQTLETFVDCMLYSVLEYEKKIKKTAKDSGKKRKKVHKKSLEVSEQMKRSLKEHYEKLREACNDRICKA